MSTAPPSLPTSETLPANRRPTRELAESLPEQALAELVELASRISEAPLALLALNDEERAGSNRPPRQTSPKRCATCPFTRRL